MSTKEKKIVINAINDLGRRVSAADVATKSGISLASSTLLLNQIAAETSGHLQVSPVGDIAYQFPTGYQTAYISRGIKRFIERLSQQLFHIGFFILRISFGIMLILSLLSIVLIFFVIVLANSRSKDNDDFQLDLDFFDWMILRDLLFWQFNTSPYDVREIDKETAGPGKFLYHCFSFLFGDGNPNINIEERRWQSIAELIRQMQGAVISEQLAPYFGNNPTNEDEVLPVLVRYEGQPTVTESGNIVYLFPSLQAQAATESIHKLPAYLNILPWRFSQVDESSMIWVIALAAVNFFGSWALYFEASKDIYLAYLSPLLLVLVIYGTFFIAIPTIRYFVIQTLNKRIAKENELRESYAKALERPDERLKEKLAQAKKMLLSAREIKAAEAIYDTQKDVLEQEFHNISNA